MNMFCFCYRIMPPVRWKQLLFVAVISTYQIFTLTDAQRNTQDSISISADGWRPIVGTRRQPPAFGSDVRISQYKNPSQVEVVKAETKVLSSSTTTVSPEKSTRRSYLGESLNNINADHGTRLNGGSKIPPHTKHVPINPQYQHNGGYHTIPTATHVPPKVVIKSVTPGRPLPLVIKKITSPPPPRFQQQLQPQQPQKQKLKPIRGQVAQHSSYQFISHPSNNVKIREAQGLGLLGTNHFSSNQPHAHIEFTNRFPPSSSNFEQFKSNPVTYIFSKGQPQQFKNQNDEYTRNLVPPPLSRIPQDKLKLKNVPKLQDNVIVPSVTEAVINFDNFAAIKNFGARPQIQENLVPFGQNFGFPSHQYKPKDHVSDVQVTKENVKYHHPSTPGGLSNFRNQPLPDFGFDFRSTTNPAQPPRLQTYEVTEANPAQTDTPLPMNENGEINEITTQQREEITTQRPKTRRRRPQPRRTTTTSTTTTTTTTEEPSSKYADVDPNLKNFKRPCQHDSKALNCKKVSLQYIRQHRGKFFEVPSKILQDQKLCRYMSVLPPVRKRSREMDSQKPKTFSVYYYFPCGKGTFRVCRSFLSAVFNVKKGRLRSVARTLSLGNVPKETRGGRRLSNINETKKQNVRDFLNRLPACESHYNRQKSKRVYLAADLNIATLHRMYNTESQSDLHVTLSMFKRLFYSEFNIGFSSPASDVCGTCLNLKNAIKKDNEDRLKTELKVHQIRANAFYKLMGNGAIDAISICFDLQQVHPLPKTPIQDAFYKRQISFYTFCCVDVKSRFPVFYTWNETEDEYFFAITLKKDETSYVFDPEAKIPEDCQGGHKLVIKQALLDSEAAEGEINVIQVEAMTWKDSVKIPIATLKAGGPTNHVLLDISLPDPPITFSLIKGNGPVHITGLHLVGSPIFEPEMEDEMEEEQLDDEEDGDSEEDDEEQKAKKAKMTNSVKGKTPVKNSNSKSPITLDTMLMKFRLSNNNSLFSVHQDNSEQELPTETERPYRRQRPRPNRYRDPEDRPSRLKDSEERPNRVRDSEDRPNRVRDSEDRPSRHRTHQTTGEGDESTEKRGQYESSEYQNQPVRKRVRPTTTESQYHRPSEIEPSIEQNGESETFVGTQETFTKKVRPTQEAEPEIYNRYKEEEEQPVRPYETTSANEFAVATPSVEATEKPTLVPVTEAVITTFHSAPENEVDFSTTQPQPEQIFEHQTVIVTTLPPTTIPSTTSTTEETSTTKATKSRGRPMKYNTANRPRFSVKDYRQRFPGRLRTRPTATTTTTTPSYSRDEEGNTEPIFRRKFKPKDPRHQISSTENPSANIITETSVKAVNPRLRPFGRFRTTTESSENKVSIKSDLFNIARRRNSFNSRNKLRNKNVTEDATTVNGIEATEPVTTQSPADDNQDEEISTRIHRRTTEPSYIPTESNTEVVSEDDYSQRVSELTSSFKNEGYFKSLSTNTRRIPSHFAISTEDPILPIEAFFPNIKEKENNKEA
nr:unnamed protein product [Callosobruchus chinensis]